MDDSNGTSRPKLRPAMICPFDNLFYQKQCKYVMNVVVVSVRGALFRIFHRKKNFEKNRFVKNIGTRRILVHFQEKIKYIFFLAV